ncbi:MAG: hypothetical protein HY644_10450 [Acidobacteria bacterium]|nr:hypothetical protein [Acidobacteriota bacterium]
MAVVVTSKLYFAITFPANNHVPCERLSLLARKQLQDIEVIETIDHLFRCGRCFSNYRYIYRSINSPPEKVPVLTS